MEFWFEKDIFQSIDDVFVEIENMAKESKDENLKRALCSKWFEYEFKMLLYKELYELAKVGFEVRMVKFDYDVLCDYVYSKAKGTDFKSKLFDLRY